MSDFQQIAGVILAGGQSRRMGGADKALMPLADRPLIRHVIDRLQPQCATLLLNANGDPSRLAGFGLPILPDPIGDHWGPLAGILAGLEWAEIRKFDAILSVATDTPFLPRDLLVRFRALGDPSRIGMARSEGRLQPVCALWPTWLVKDLRRALEQGIRKVEAFTESYPVTPVDWPAPAFFNINRPEDLAEAERLP